jgi:hypothetical protein
MKNPGITMKVKYLLCLCFVAVFASSGWACHEEDTNLDGHKPKTGVGIIVSTEIVVAFSSTTTSCDMYTAYLQSNYEQIAENAAKGEGPHLEALIAYRGCPSDSLASLRKAFKVEYASLFPASDPNGEKFPERFEALLNSEELNFECVPLRQSIS